jgi:hypothetical protein
LPPEIVPILLSWVIVCSFNKPAPPGAFERVEPVPPRIEPLFAKVVIAEDSAAIPVGPPWMVPLEVTEIAAPLLKIGPATVVEMVWFPGIAPILQIHVV